MGQLIDWVRHTCPANRIVIKDYIISEFNITYSLDAISKLLKRNGIKRLRPKLVPGKPPTLEKQVNFILHYFQIKRFAEQDSGLVQLFGDGMHLVHQVIPDYCWGDPKSPPMFNSNSSRQRLNIMGAYDLIDQRFIHLSCEKPYDETKSIEFLEKLVNSYPQKHSIVLYLDNAPYFKSKVVQAWLQDHPQMIIEYLPVYAPNLNLIERLWRFVKGHLVKNRYYSECKTFRLLNNLKEYSKKLRLLITDNFHLVAQY
ncbi:IS630 family transposase [bacterium]|nr:IS630 family transposase [bacterium]